MFWYLGNQAPVDRCNHHPRLMNGGCCILINPTALAVDEGCRGRDHLTRTLGKGGLKGRGDFYEMPRYLMTLVDKVIEFHQSKQNQSTGQRRHLLCPEKKNLTTQGLRRTRCARGLPPSPPPPLYRRSRARGSYFWAPTPSFFHIRELGFKVMSKLTKEKTKNNKNTVSEARVTLEARLLKRHGHEALRGSPPPPAPRR